MDALFDNPLLLVLVLVLLLGGLAAVVVLRRKREDVDAGKLPGLDELLKTGNYLQAAMLAQRHGWNEQAIDYFLRAQEPLRAAQLAARTNNVKRAAELYERGGDTARAAQCYEEAGLTDKAHEVRGKLPPAKTASGDAVATPAGDQPPPSTPSDPEAVFRKLASEAADDDVSRARLQQAGADTAEQLLRMGDIRKAADIYRDAGLVDEAVHLFVNVLGSPGDAAPLMAARGNHERAAELYELAGKLERAAAQWIDVARSAPRPEVFVERIERLSPDGAYGFLREVTVQRPLSADTVELHYRFAVVLEHRGEREQAVRAYEVLQEAMGDYKDVRDRLMTLRSPTGETRQGASIAPEVARSVPPQDAGAPHHDLPRQRSIRPEGYHSSIAPPESSDAPIGGAAPAPQPRLSGSDFALSVDQVSAIASQAVQAALAQASRAGVLAPMPSPTLASASIDRAANRAQRAVLVIGLEQRALPLDVLADAPAVAAKGGPSIDSLMAYIAGRSCDLQNIEVYYRLGLAYLAAGRWEDAQAAFEAVEEASPGYRDADKRNLQIQEWQQAVGPRLSVATRSAVSPNQPSRYKIHGELGRGGMAVVYRATDEVLGRDVALKFLADELMAQKEMRDMFQREARAAAQLNHPNIITVYDFGVHESKAFICMEYVEGCSLESHIDEHGKLPVIEALRNTLQILDALQYAHEQGFIHRDIKPSNVMRTRAGVMKLMDFGLAKSLAAGNKASIIAGTPAYMPPEQFSGGEVDQRSDLFAVGCSLYEMLTGKLPFKSAERIQPPADIRSFDPSFPAALQGIVARALEFDIKARFPDARSFAAPLSRMVGAVDEFTRSSPRVAPAPAPTPEAAPSGLKATAPSRKR